MDRIAASCGPSFPVISVDDSQVEYCSLLGEEERRRRFSEVLDDENLRETIRLEKMLRQIQRKVYFRNQIMAGVRDCAVLLCLFIILFRSLSITKGSHNPWLSKKSLDDTEIW